MAKSQPSLRLVRSDRKRSLDTASLKFTAEEKRQVFKGMVVSELESGFLRYSRRQALLKYAQVLGIGEFEASLLIAEAQFRSGDIEPASFHTPVDLDSLTRPHTWSIPVRMGFVIAAAILVDLLLIYWIFY
jgi:hypothetical protein